MKTTSSSTPLTQTRPALVLMVLGALVGAMFLGLPQASPAHADATGTGGDYVPLTTVERILDTRNGTGISGTAPLAERVEKSFPVLGVAGLPTENVSAVLVDVTLLNPSESTLFKVWADGAPQPVQGVVHSAIKPVSNAAVIPVNDSGRLRIWNWGGTAHAIIDVQGYFTKVTSSGGPGGFVPVTETRVIDSRSNIGTTGGAIPAGGSRTVTLAPAGVPAGTTTLYATVAALGATVEGYLRFLPGTATTAAGGPDFTYPLHSSSAGTTLRLSGGKLTIVNKGAAAVNVVVDVEGYFSPTSTLGAGYRPADARLLDTRGGATRLAAQSSMNFAVGGAGGLPVRAIAGALLNIHSQKNTAGANALVAWPTGTAMPPISSNNNPGNTGEAGNTSTASLNIIKPGANGMVTIRNLGATDIDVYIDLEGYFLDPLPPVAIEKNSRTSILQSTASAPTSAWHLEFSYVDNSGQLRHGDIPDPDAANNQDTITIQTLSGGEAFTGTPAIAEQANGKLLIAGHHTESNVWAKTGTLTDPVPDWPSAWTKLGGSIRSHAAVGTLSDSRLALFGVDADGALWASIQSAANSAFGAWTALGDADLTGTPVVVRNPGGGVQIFARSLSGNIVSATYSAGTLSSWVNLGNPGVALDDTGVPAVAVGPTLIRVFVRTPAGEIATQQQSVGGSWSDGWEIIPGAVAGGPPTAVAHPTNGTYQVFTRTSEGGLQWVSEMTRNSGTWSTWMTFAAPGGNVLISDPTAFTWVASAPKMGVIYRISSDTNRIAGFTDTTPPPAPEEGVQAKTSTAKKSSTAKKPATGGRSTPEFHTYTAAK
jgi:hypothetical protein